MKNSLQKKLLFSFMLVIIVLISGVIFGVSSIIKEQTLATKQKDLIAKATELASDLKIFHAENGNFNYPNNFLSNAENYLNVRIWVLDASRRVVSMSNPGIGRIPNSRMNAGPGMGHQEQSGMFSIINEIAPAFDGKVCTKTFNSPYYGEKMLIVAAPIFIENNQVGGVVLLHSPVASVNTFLQNIYYYIAGAGLLAVILALLVLNYLTRNMIQPLKAMEETASAMAKGDYKTLVEVKTTDEVGHLGLALNSLAKDLSNYISELDKMEKLRRDFLSNFSHELKTPLTIIRGYNAVLLDDTIDDPSKVKDYYLIIWNETARLERLINDLLNLSRLQSTKIGKNIEKIPLVPIVESVVNMIRLKADQKKIKLVTEFPENFPATQVNTDQITQLLLIFLDNAIKYTPSGGTISTKIFFEDDAAILEIADTGIGIPTEDLPYIWERFYKVDKSHCREDSGIGLGLAIAKQIIELHQATVVVTSELGQGTTITIRFPIG